MSAVSEFENSGSTFLGGSKNTAPWRVGQQPVHLPPAPGVHWRRPRHNIPTIRDNRLCQGLHRQTNEPLKVFRWVKNASQIASQCWMLCNMKWSSGLAPLPAVHFPLFHHKSEISLHLQGLSRTPQQRAPRPRSRRWMASRWGPRDSRCRSRNPKMSQNLTRPKQSESELYVDSNHKELYSMINIWFCLLMTI